jgi:AcrR family transcriptional regulator
MTMSSLLEQAGFHRLSLERVAKQADVSRLTVYYQFGSKLGLLEAVVEDAIQRAGMAQLLQAIDLPDPAEALRATIQAGCHFWATDHALFQRVIGLAAVDPETRQVVDAREATRRSVLGRLIERLDNQKLLRSDCSPQKALDVLWLLTGFGTFDDLFSGCGRSVEEIVIMLLDLIQCVLAEPLTV